MRFLLLVSLLLGTFAFRFQAQPPQDLDDWDDLELIFSHQNHLVEEGLLCEDCHLDVGESTTGEDNLLPEMETCGFCHDIEDLDNCGMCHENADEPEELPRIDDYSPKFSHQRHMEEADLECESCHPGVEEQTIPEATDLPDMLDCMDCHEDERVEAECLTCHLETERLVPTSHTADFMHGHGTLAQSEDLADDEHMTCATCHSEHWGMGDALPRSIGVGGEGPHMCRMAGKHADGLLFNGSHPADLSWARDRVEEGKGDRPTERGDFDLAAYASVSVAEHEDAARAAARPPVAFIAAGAAPPVLDRHGVDRSLASDIGEKISAGEFSEAFELVTDAMLDAFCVAGTEDEVAARFAALVGGGAVQGVAVMDGAAAGG